MSIVNCVSYAAGHRLHEVAVPTLIAGIYGMNFEVTPELHWAFGYPTAMLTMVGACAYLYYRFRTAGWL